MVDVANYQNPITKNRVEGKSREREVCFGDYQKLLDNGDRIGNLLEHN
jgi:hypothetical protein